MNDLERYRLYIYELFKNLTSYTNIDLCKIFEYYACIHLTNEYKNQYYEYSDIDPNLKEELRLSKRDTGIDAFNLKDTIVQCKLRKEIKWPHLGTFLGSNVKRINGILQVRWQYMIFARNDDCHLTDTFKENMDVLIDKKYNKNNIIKYCKDLVKNPPKVIIKEEDIVLRDYQIECIDLIKKNKENIIINLPTGTGKNIIIIHSMEKGKKYLILVPRIVLMEQIEDMIKKYKSDFKIQKYGDNSKRQFDTKKDVTICVYNSIELIKDYYETFDKIFIDEAHHIYKPEIYKNEELQVENEEKYIEIIRSFERYKNNIFLSATIDKKDGFIYYTKGIREMIEKEYLSDYTINIPIFNKDPDNERICRYLIQRYMYVIIYCSTTEEGKNINKLMNKIQYNSSKYIDHKTSKGDRQRIIKDFKNGAIPFLVNVRVLTEGFDAPITRGVVFMHLPKNAKTIIQIIGRCLRKHNTKNYASVILPYSTEENGKAINNFIKIIAKNDGRIAKSYNNKNLHGYINPDFVVEDEDDEEEMNDIDLKFTMIYNSMCVLENGEEIWYLKLGYLRDYLVKNKKRPKLNDENEEIRKIASWIITQNKNIKNNLDIMKNPKIREAWIDFKEEFKEYLKSYEDIWRENKEIAIDFFEKNERLPKRSVEEEKSIEIWLMTNKKNAKNRTQIQKNDEINEEWIEFTEKYKKYLLTNTEKWKDTLENVKEYINENKKKPMREDENTEIQKLGIWINTQSSNYNKNLDIMKDKEIRYIWENFLEEYKEYVITKKSKNKSLLEKAADFIDENKKKPTRTNKNKEIAKIAEAVDDLMIRYRNPNSRRNEEFIKFIEKYGNYYLTYEEKWYEMLNSVKEFIDKNKKKPGKCDLNKTGKNMCYWLDDCFKNYKKNQYIMKNAEIRKEFEKFIQEYKL
jgi:superfamily II DNA or RNA helicase